MNETDSRESLPHALPFPNYTDYAKRGIKDHPNFENKTLVNRCFISGTSDNSAVGGKLMYMVAVIPHLSGSME